MSCEWVLYLSSFLKLYFMHKTKWTKRSLLSFGLRRWGFNLCPPWLDYLVFSINNNFLAFFCQLRIQYDGLNQSCQTRALVICTVTGSIVSQQRRRRKVRGMLGERWSEQGHARLDHILSATVILFSLNQQLLFYFSGAVFFPTLQIKKIIKDYNFVFSFQPKLKELFSF